MRRLLLAAVGLGWAGAAAAQDGEALTGTLKAIQDRGTILVGTRDAAPPFSFRNPAGQPIGFSVDLCHGIAADVANALHRDLVEADAPAWQTGVRIVYVPVSADARLPKIVSGEIDLECGSTTANAERGKTVAFSPVFFLAGTRLLVPAASPARSYRDLAGKTIVAGAGTTNAEVMRRLDGSVTPPFALATAPDLDAAYAQLAAGKADAFASDDVLLAGMASTKPGGADFRITGDFLSFEPYALILRRDDAPFAGLVRDSFQRMAASGELTARYNRWFVDRLPNGTTMNLPISAQLTEMFRALGQSD